MNDFSDDVRSNSLFRFYLTGKDKKLQRALKFHIMTITIIIVLDVNWKIILILPQRRL